MSNNFTYTYIHIHRKQPIIEIREMQRHECIITTFIGTYIYIPTFKSLGKISYNSGFSENIQNIGRMYFSRKSFLGCYIQQQMALGRATNMIILFSSTQVPHCLPRCSFMPLQWPCRRPLSPCYSPVDYQDTRSYLANVLPTPSVFAWVCLPRLQRSLGIRQLSQSTLPKF